VNLYELPGGWLRDQKLELLATLLTKLCGVALRLLYGMGVAELRDRL
jgi:hypothetical protein